MYSESELTDNDSYSESDEGTDEESGTINSIDECDEAPEDEPNDIVLHDIEPSMFFEQFRTICQRKIQTWEEYRERNIVEYTNTKNERKKRRESTIDKSKGTIEVENISMGGCSMTPRKGNMKALAIEPAAKYLNTPNRQIHSQSKGWEKSQKHKTEDTTKREDEITQEINTKTMQQFGQHKRKYVKKNIADSSDDDDDAGEMEQFVSVNTKRAIKSNVANGVDGVAEEFFETVTTTTTTTTVKKFRRLSLLPSVSAPVNALKFDSDFSSDDSEPRLPAQKGMVKRRHKFGSDECPITPKKKVTSGQHKAYSMESSEMASSVVVVKAGTTPRRSMIVSAETIEKEYLAKCSNKDDIDTSNFRPVRVRNNETLKVVVPKTPSSSNTPVKRSHLLAIDQTPHKGAEKKRDILCAILESPRCTKPILVREK